MEEGLPENLNVSVVSAADLDRLSSDPFLREARQSPLPANAPETAPAPEDAQAERDAPVEPEPEAKQASAAPPPRSLSSMTSPRLTTPPASSRGRLSNSHRRSSMPSTRRTPSSEQAKRAARSAGNVTAMRPGATHSGKSDAFERDVVWALSATKPMGNGKWGSAVVTFVVTEVGPRRGPEADQEQRR